MNQFQYRKTTACTYIEYFNFIFLLVFQNTIHGNYVCLSQVYYVDIVTNTRTVRSIIIITEYAQFFTDAHCCLSKEWNQVLRNTVRKFTNQSCWMCTNRIEITQHHCMDRRTRSNGIADNFFINLLRITVWRFSLLDRSFFCYRQYIRLAVYRTRRREDNTFYSVFRHQFQQVNQRNQIVTIIQQRFLNRFTYSLTCCKMNDSLNTRIFSKHIVQSFVIKTIYFFKSWAHT